MLPACRTADETFAIPQFALTRSDIDAFPVLAYGEVDGPRRRCGHALLGFRQEQHHIGRVLQVAAFLRVSALRADCSRRSRA